MWVQPRLVVYDNSYPDIQSVISTVISTLISSITSTITFTGPSLTL